MDASHGKLTADVRGEIEKEDGVLVIKRIHAVFCRAAMGIAGGFGAYRPGSRQLIPDR